MNNRRESRVVRGQRDGSNGVNGGQESLDELAFIDIEDRGSEHLTLIVDVGNPHTICEGGNVKHVQQGSLGGSDLGTSFNELEVGGNFNGTTGNLGRDTESLEERGLAGFHTSVTGWDVDIERGDSTGTGRSGNLVGEDLVADHLEVIVGENETDIACENFSEIWVAIIIIRNGLSTLNEREKTFIFGEIAHQDTNGTANHGVLAHKDNTLASEGDTNLMHLLGRDLNSRK